jgi:precorrin-6B C5,15-methyltransferase / cobalt-precorrin-6B C5,C15-methyltransferase
VTGDNTPGARPPAAVTESRPAEPPAVPSRVAVVGVNEPLAKDAQRAVEQADLVVGSRRQLDAVGRDGLELFGPLPDVLDAVAAEPGAVCVLASGDPGFFGIVRPLAERFGPAALDVYPAPSSVARAFARLGLPWDDAVVVSAHGRPLAEAVGLVLHADKGAVLVSPENSPQALGRALLDGGATHTGVAVCSHLGLAGERVDRTDLAALAAGEWDPLSVVVLFHGTGVAAAKSLAFGLPDAAYAHRGGMITKAEVRAVVLSKLQVPATGVLWDVGAGSGSVSLECAAVAPTLDVYAVEREPADLRANAAGSAVHIVEGEAPGALAALPDPDRVFVGGGGVDVLEAARVRLQPGGRIVATYAAVDRAAAAAHRLGHLTQVSIARGSRLPDGSFRLAAENPVFVAWGPDE